MSIPSATRPSSSDTLDVPFSGRNLLLEALPPHERALLLKHLKRVSFATGAVVYAAGAPITHVHFIENCVMSVLALLRDGEAVEVGTIGKEGVVGLALFFGAERVPRRTIAQISGDALSMTVADFQRTVEASPALQKLLVRYTEAFFDQVAQSVACNRLHSVEQRCARWLLMTHDRVGRENFMLTQEFLAYMLGVRRPGVTVAAGALQRRGLIRYTRGRISVLDRPGLEAASCECYGAVRDSLALVTSAVGSSAA